MSKETENLKLFKWDTTSETDLNNKFDIEKTLNENWEKLDINAGNIQEELENLRNITNVLPTVSEKGENITLNNTAKNVRFRKFGIGGNVKQETRSGKNLLELMEGTYSNNGITAVVKSGVITLNGTATDISFVSVNLLKSLNLITGKTYHLSIFNSKAVGDSSNICALRLNQDGTKQASFDKVNSNLAIDGNFLFSYITVRTPAGITYNNFEIKPQFETENGTDTWEQGGAMPSLDYRSQVKAVGDNVNLANLGEKAQYTSSGFTVSWKDSVFKMSGTASTNLTIPANVTGVTNAINLGNFKAGTYTVSRKILNGNVVNVKGSGIYLRSSNGMIASIYIASTKDRASFTLTEDTNIYIYVFIDSGTQYSDLEIGIKIVEGTEVGEYSKYNQGSTKIVKCNTNLYDGKSEVGGINNDGSLSSTTDRWRTINYINVKNLKNLIIRVYDIETSGALGRYCLYDDKYNFLSSVQILNTQTDLKVDNASYLKFWFLNEKVASSAQVQVEEGNTAKKYNQHEEQSYIMPVQQEMLTDDFFDWDNEEEVHGWKKIILNGTENWQLYSAGTNISRRFGLALTENVPFKETEKYGKGYSTHFEITQFINGDLSIFLQVEPNNWYIAVTDVNSKWSSIVEFKSWLKAKYDAGTPVIIYYKTAAETRLKFTDEQKAVAKEIQKATSYEDTTHIYSTDEVSPVFDVEAVINLKKLIANTSTTAEGEN